jgi:inner membrane transporter RhtA
VVTIQFVGPLAVAVAGSRRALDVVWVVLAAAGIALLAGGAGDTIRPAGVVLAAVAGVLWACFILIGGRVGRAFPGTAPLVAAMALGAVLLLPWGVLSAGPHLGDVGLLAAAAGVGLLSSAVPWTLELEALRRLPSHVYGILVSLSPAVAALSGFVLLGEHLRPRAWVAIGLVVLASAAASRGQSAEPPRTA